MPAVQRDAWVRAYLEDVFNRHNLQSLDNYMTKNLVSHWLGDRILHGHEAWGKAMASFFNAFPDADYTLNDLFFAGDKVCGGGLGTAPNEGSGREFPQLATRPNGR